jgi:hypothetical protein
LTNSTMQLCPEGTSIKVMRSKVRKNGLQFRLGDQRSLNQPFSEFHTKAFVSVMKASIMPHGWFSLLTVLCMSVLSRQQ